MRAVVAPCFGPELQVQIPRCMPHQIPTYLPGLIHEVSASRLGSLRLRIRWDVTRSPGVVAIWIVRHGETKGAFALTLAPSAHGTRSARSVAPPDAWSVIAA